MAGVSDGRGDSGYPCKRVWELVSGVGQWSGRVEGAGRCQLVTISLCPTASALS